MKTAEEIIIEKIGEYWWICGKYKPIFLAAMEEYAELKVKEALSQQPNDNLLADIRNKLSPMKNLCALIDIVDLSNNVNSKIELIRKEVEQSKTNIEYLKNINTQQPPVAVAWPSDDEINKLIRFKLFERGFSNEKWLNNRGLIGAVIEDTMSQSTAIDMEEFFDFYNTEIIAKLQPNHFDYVIAKYNEHLKQKQG